MNKLQKGLTAILHPFKFYKLSKRLGDELNLIKSELETRSNDLAKQKEISSALSNDLNKQKNSVLNLSNELNKQKTIAFNLSNELEKERNNSSNLSIDLEKQRSISSNLTNELEKQKLDSVYHIFQQTILGKDFSKHDRSKKQVLIIGYYGATNYGDELMLKSLLNTVDKAKEYSVMFVPNYRYNFDQWGNCFKYSPPDSIDDFNKIADFYDELIIGGGAHIDDNEIRNPAHIPFLGMELSLLLLKQNKIVRWLGVSSNREFHSIDYVNKLKQIVDGAQEFSVRDSYTLDLLVNKHGLDKEKIKLVDDLALNIKRKKIIGVTLMDFFNNKKQNIQLVNEIVSFSKNSNNNYRICFITFFNERHHDKEMYEDLTKEIDFGEVEYFIASEYNTVENMYLVIAGCDLFVNMRYHASLLSLSYGKPTVSICYDIHPHYFNKIMYINEKYNNPYVLSYSNYKEGQLLETLNKISKDM